MVKDKICHNTPVKLATSQTVKLATNPLSIFKNSSENNKFWKKNWAAVIKTPVSYKEKRGKFQSPAKIVALRDVIIHFSSRYHKKTFLFSEISLELRIFGLDKELAMIIFSAEIIYSGWVFVLIISIFRIIKQNLFKIAFQGAMGNVWGALMTIPEVSRR